MLEDSRMNFAISSRGEGTGPDHLGIQLTSAHARSALQAQAQQADMTLLGEGENTYRHARSDKHWNTDPQGVAREPFHTLDSIPVFREAGPTAGVACSAPAVAANSATSCCDTAPTAEVASCCGASDRVDTTGQRC